MAVVEKTIGPSGDYESIADWLIDLPDDPDLVWRGVLI